MDKLNVDLNNTKKTISFRLEEDEYDQIKSRPFRLSSLLREFCIWYNRYGSMWYSIFTLPDTDPKCRLCFKPGLYGTGEKDKRTMDRVLDQEWKLITATYKDSKSCMVSENWYMCIECLRLLGKIRQENEKKLEEAIANMK